MNEWWKVTFSKTLMILSHSNSNSTWLSLCYWISFNLVLYFQSFATLEFMGRFHGVIMKSSFQLFTSVTILYKNNNKKRHFKNLFLFLCVLLEETQKKKKEWKERKGWEDTLSRAHGQCLQVRVGKQVLSEVGSPPFDFSSLFKVDQTDRERKHFTWQCFVLIEN